MQKQKTLKLNARKGYRVNSGGPERIRTAVEAFAELCLATRPKDHYLKTNGFSLELLLSGSANEE